MKENILIADGETIEINGQKFLITKVQQSEQNKPVIDLHKDSWAVLNDGSQRFKDTVIKWINEHKNPQAQGVHIAEYYGITPNGLQCCYENTEIFTHILTIDEFCALAYPKEEGSELVGKWVRYIDSSDVYFTNNKWYKCVGDVKKSGAFISNRGEKDGMYPINNESFDLSNPLDYNPETLVGKYYNGYKISSIEIFEEGMPYFHFEDLNIDDVFCKDLTPADVTDEPPLKSLEYEDCFERLLSLPQESVYQALNGIQTIFKTNPCQAKQLAATIKLMTIMHDANSGWVPKHGEQRHLLNYDSTAKNVFATMNATTLNSPIYFKDHETAQRAYEQNKEIFHDYFGIGGENE